MRKSRADGYQFTAACVLPNKKKGIIEEMLCEMTDIEWKTSFFCTYKKKLESLSAIFLI